MTKQEVRAVTLSKLALTKSAVCWDVGAGTGSVSLEMAACCEDGRVYAIEHKANACALIEKNKLHLGVTNVEVVEGEAPEALEALEAPTHVFIGGSSGNLRAILECVLRKNPKARIVMNTVTVCPSPWRAWWPSRAFRPRGGCKNTCRTSRGWRPRGCRR